ncbi:putative protease inhibitor (Tfs1) [Sclerotinia borealis F-4128]|uniref:Putative protease inhibitor (Tfs1) n=1 Tax=Sclerotinia borealis (strain F-4128) TaxID=1432307 RepID=W9CWN5_SCLBF|nr:putative protease inhibitor (Tfs1) [Sclerotinia borealis F-4128]
MPTNAVVKRILDAIEKDPSKVLGVTVNGKAITTKQYIPRAEAQTTPEIFYDVSNPSATYIVVALDLDAPFPSLGFLGPILHWIQPGFKVGQNNILTSDAPFIANYIGPSPPPGSAPHRYTFFLFEQPENFDGEKYAPSAGKLLSNWFRMRYDLDDWQKTAQLGEPLAVNYFLSN